MINLSLDDSGRHHRQELITWWDQQKLKSSKVLVVGAGAIGNEVVKNLVLVGVGSIDVCDMDTIENSNLSRCVFFREEDLGRFKSEILVERARELDNEIALRSFIEPVQRVGIGRLSDYDLIIGALDNREARAWVNQACRKLGKAWIDGAIEGLRGIVRYFAAEGPCYACTLTEADYKQMSHRRSCALLAPEDLLEGKTPTNATTASLVAAVQVQEAIKALVGREDLLALKGACWVYVGDTMTAYVTKYSADPDCLAHDFYDQVHTPDESIETLADLVNLAQNSSLIADVSALDFEEDLVTIYPCPDHGQNTVTKVRSAIGLGAARCSVCQRDLLGEIQSSVSQNHEIVAGQIKDLGFAQSDIITLRSGNQRVHFKLGAQNG
jgi:molybdopterin/thiamine biosynthesis adenylyltransferase